jgi:hypothetical protein
MSGVIANHWLASPQAPWRPRPDQVAAALERPVPAVTEVARAALLAAADHEAEGLHWLLASAPLWAASCLVTASWVIRFEADDEQERERLAALGRLWACVDDLQRLAWRSRHSGVSAEASARARRCAHRLISAYLAGCTWLWDIELAEVGR